MLSAIASKRGGKASGGLNVMTDRLFYTHVGQVGVSALFGIALALVFMRVCKDRKCLVIRAPPTQDIKNKVYHIEGECFQYTPFMVPCPSDEQGVVPTGDA